MRVVKTMAAGGGYECSFVETPREDIDTECPICLLVLRQPSQVECCGRVFCTGCLQRALRDNDCCPMCKARAPRVFTDQNIHRILAGRRVYCVHRSCGEGERGCQWTGELGQLDSHLNPNQNQKGCLFVNVTCSLCGEAMKLSSLSQHQESDCPKRSYSCPHCHIQRNYDYIVNSHLGKCPYYPCECPHCYQRFEHRKLHHHINNGCILAPFPCPFKPVGCQEDLLRLELDTHIKESVGIHAQLLLEHGRASGKHMALFRTSLKEICRENSELSLQNSELSSQNSELSVKNSELSLQNSELSVKNSELSLQNSELSVKNSEQNSELSLQVATFTVQQDTDKKRIKSLQNFKLAVFVVIGVLIPVIIALATTWLQQDGCG